MTQYIVSIMDTSVWQLIFVSSFFFGLFFFIFVILGALGQDDASDTDTIDELDHDLASLDTDLDTDLNTDLGTDFEHDLSHDFDHDLAVLETDLDTDLDTDIDTDFDTDVDSDLGTNLDHDLTAESIDEANFDMDSGFELQQDFSESIASLNPAGRTGKVGDELQELSAFINAEAEGLQLYGLSVPGKITGVQLQSNCYCVQQAFGFSREGILAEQAESRLQRSEEHTSELQSH